MENDIYKKTKALLKQLNHFIVHVTIYFFVNVVMVLFAYSNIQERWWMLFFIISWGAILIYHGLRVYWIDSTKRRKNKFNHLAG